jgi:hypothetical protein
MHFPEHAIIEMYEQDAIIDILCTFQKKPILTFYALF